MAKLKGSTTVKSESGVVLNAAPADVSSPPPPKAELLSFENYCALKNVPVLHQAGMRAFTTTKLATLTEWSRIFSRY